MDRVIAADPNAFAVRDGAGLSDVDERAIRHMNGRRPCIHKWSYR